MILYYKSVIVTKLLGGYVSNQVQYNVKSA